MKFIGALIIGFSAWFGVSAYRRLFPSAGAAVLDVPTPKLPGILNDDANLNPKA